MTQLAGTGGLIIALIWAVRYVVAKWTETNDKLVNLLTTTLEKNTEALNRNSEILNFCRTRATGDTTRTFPPPALPLIALCLLMVAGGCTVSRFRTENASVASYTVAWPWMDTTKALEKAKLDYATNKQGIALSGYTESEATSTNAAALLERTIGAAVGAAVKAAKP